MGDHAANIAKTTYYMVEGRPLPDERPKGDRSPRQRVTGSRAAHRGPSVVGWAALFVTTFACGMEAARTEAGVNHRSGPSPHFPT
jgi:hypothetical protein